MDLPRGWPPLRVPVLVSPRAQLAGSLGVPQLPISCLARPHGIIFQDMICGKACVYKVSVQTTPSLKMLLHAVIQMPFFPPFFFTINKLFARHLLPTPNFH